MWKALAAGVDPAGSRATAVSPSDVSDVLNTLLKRGLIESKHCEDDLKSAKHSLLLRFLHRASTNRLSQLSFPPSLWMRVRLYLEAYLLLMLVDLSLHRLGFHVLFAELSKEPSRSHTTCQAPELIEMLSSISLGAFRWYRPSAACAHRAFGLYIFLRRHGIRAELCLGVDPCPFESHAWVEHEGKVLGDSPTFCSGFLVIARSC